MYILFIISSFLNGINQLLKFIISYVSFWIYVCNARLLRYGSSNGRDSILKVGQTSRSLGQTFWFPCKGLVTRNAHVKYRCLWNTNDPLRQLIKNRLDLWPTNLNIDRGHLLIKDYLSTKFERSGAKRSWVISCTRWSRLAWPLTLTFWPEYQ